MLTEKAYSNLKKLEGYKGTYETFEDFELVNPNYIPEDNDVIYCTIEDSLYVYNDKAKDWHEIPVPKNNEINTGLTQYEIDKMAVESLGPLKDGEKRHARSELNKLNRNSDVEYYMMLFKEISYYTLFHNIANIEEKNITNNLGSAVLECLNDIGIVYSIQYIQKDNYSIWIKTYDDKMIEGFLFPYDRGIVNVYKGGTT